TGSGILVFDRWELADKAGTRFVCNLYALGGYRAIDTSERERPTTTAQILYPERYIVGEEAVPPPAPGTLGTPSRRTTITTMGAADLVGLFAAPGGDPQRALRYPRELGKAWGGGTAEVWQAGNARAFGISLVEHKDFDSLCNSMQRWYHAA